MKHTTIRGLVRTSEEATAGSGRNSSKGRAWTAVTSGGTRFIYHYSTLMLSYDVEDDGFSWDGNVDTVEFSIGHGSVSDQQGMNLILRETGIPAYFERAGGAGYVWLPRERHYA